jgi:hypothetical protein
MVRVEDPEAAREGFEQWGVVRNLNLDDLRFAEALRVRK